MNIFILDDDPATCAKYHCDKHVVKMTLETAQILCTVQHMYNYDAPYKPTHKNHPCVRWAASNQTRYNWLWFLGMHLSEEYRYRYGKSHKSENVISELYDPPARMNISGLRDPFELAIPLEYKCGSAVESYRNYYRAEKRHFATWKNRPIPEWFNLHD